MQFTCTHSVIYPDSKNCHFPIVVDKLNLCMLGEVSAYSAGSFLRLAILITMETMPFIFLVVVTLVIKMFFLLCNSIMYIKMSFKTGTIRLKCMTNYLIILLRKISISHSKKCILVGAGRILGQVKTGLRLM